MAFAKLATRRDLIQPFYITDEHVKEVDENNNPTCIQVILGRSPTGQAGSVDKQMFDSDFQIGDRMKISKKHAMIFWNHEDENWYIKSICKNNVRVNGEAFAGSSNGEGRHAKLASKSTIEIADGTTIYFLLPKGKLVAAEKPKTTYEHLITSVLDQGQLLTLNEIITRIQEKYPYYAEDSIHDSQTWKGSLRTTLNTKSKTFEKTNKVDAAGKKVMYWSMKKEGDEDGQGDGGVDAAMHEGGAVSQQDVVHEAPMPPSDMQTDPSHM